MSQHNAANCIVIYLSPNWDASVAANDHTLRVVPTTPEYRISTIEKATETSLDDRTEFRWDQATFELSDWARVLSQVELIQLPMPSELRIPSDSSLFM